MRLVKDSQPVADEPVSTTLRHACTQVAPLDAATAAAGNALLDWSAAPDIKIAFIGEYNAGKSSLINLLLRDEVTPVGRFPETGAPIRITPAGSNAIFVTQNGQRRQVGDDLAELRSISSLTQGGRRVEEARPDLIEITRSRVDLPQGVTLLDTPGLNDHEGMTERAIRTAYEADALVWVFHSRQFLTMPEARIITEIAERGWPKRILFVLNDFSQEKSETAWEILGQDSAAHQRDKLTALLQGIAGHGVMTSPLNEAGPGAWRPVRVSALDPHAEHAFGAADVRRAFRTFVDEARDVAAAERDRFAQASVRQTLDDAMQTALARERGHIEAAAATHQKWKIRKDNAKKFHDSVSDDVRMMLASYVRQVRDAGDEVHAEINGGLYRDDRFSKQFAALVSSARSETFSELMEQITALARMHEQPPVTADTRSRVGSVLPSPSPDIEVPNYSVDGGSTNAGTVIGGIIGAPLGPLGIAVGAFVGNRIGRGNAVTNAIARDRAGAHENVDSAVASAVRRIEGAAESIVDVVARACMDDVGSPPTVNRAQLQAWESVAATLARIPT